MAVAIVQHEALIARAKEIGFPLYTKLPCNAGCNGFLIWDKWVRENVEWVTELQFDPTKHVKITESAKMIGELKNPWELTCQKYLEGSPDYNSFNPIVVEGEEFQLHVNRQAIQVLVSNASLKYKIDFETDDSGAVTTHNRLTLALFDDAESTSISYQSDVEVAQLWTTRVTDEGEAGLVLWKRAYADQPEIEESYPWIVVGELTPAEHEEWVRHNVNDGKSFQHLLDRAVGGIEEAFE